MESILTRSCRTELELSCNINGIMIRIISCSHSEIKCCFTNFQIVANKRYTQSSYSKNFSGNLDDFSDFQLNPRIISSGKIKKEKTELS